MIEIYTDGACSGNPGPGGWGASLTHKGKTKEICGGEAETTNNRMEMTAAIRALEAIKAGYDGPILIHTDSTYVLKGITEWMPNWKRRGWKTAAKKPVKNADLWKELDALVAPRDIEWNWVKGHAGIAGNERADELANDGMAPFKSCSD